MNVYLLIGPLGKLVHGPVSHGGEDGVAVEVDEGAEGAGGGGADVGGCGEGGVEEVREDLAGDGAIGGRNFVRVSANVKGFKL